MSRTCARPGCAHPAAFTFLFAPAQLTVWIGDLAEDPRGFGHDLCAEHAGRFSAPVGWNVEDDRTAVDPPALEATTPMLARAFRSAHAS